MDKKIGKALAHSLLFYALVLCGELFGRDKQIQIQMYDMQRSLVSQVEVGVPFYLYAVAENFENAQEPKGLSGVPYFSFSRCGTQQEISFINGQQSKKITFMYVVTPEKKGSFSLGPVEIQDENGDSTFSEKIKIEVGDGTTITPAKHHKQPYILHAAIDNKSVYVGQKVKLLIRFCYQDQYQQLMLPDSALDNFHRGFVSQSSQKGTTKIGDEQYEHQEWLMELYPEKTGTLTIPMFQAVFIPALKYQSGFGSVFGFSTQTAVQSNPKTLEVKPLPKSKEFKDVTAVGTFDSCVFQLQQKKGAVGQGLVATMVIHGDGNLEVVKAPELKLPDGLHSYQGNSRTERLNDEKFRKTFEWIIQGDNSGTFTIEPQKFAYFDLSSQTYKILKSEKALLTLTAAAVMKSDKKEQALDTTKKSNIDQPYAFKDHEINFINQTSLNQTSLNQKVGLESLIYRILTWIIILMAILAVLIGAFWCCGPYVRKSFWAQSLYFKYLFKKSYRRQNTLTLYNLFLTLGKFYGFELLGDELAECFSTLKLPPDSWQKWQQFVHMMLAINFAGAQSSQQERQEVFAQSQYWFYVILSCCKLLKKSYPDKSVMS
ncbi:MAG: BatD family protein [Candidatus Dependentiae bacterium]|nr:BatD family protein [Candidatus Dependentiae bacterium]